MRRPTARGLTLPQVAAFRLLSNNDWGPLEACELVGLRDQLLAVNGVSVGALADAVATNAPAKED